MAKITGLELTEQEARDILTTGIEGNGIGYWANEHGPVEIWRDEETLDIYRIKLDAEDEKGEVKTYDIDTAKIITAAQQIAADGSMPELIESVIEEDVDAWDADLIIQWACFEQVIYG